MSLMLGLKAAKAVRSKRLLKFLALALLLVMLPSMMLFLAIMGFVGWLFSPVQLAPPPSLTAVRQTYLPLENAAVKQYSGCYVTQVPKYGSGHKIISYDRVWHIREVDVPFVQAVMEVESGGDAKAVSSAGALGLMQVTVGKFSAYIKKGTSPMDPKTNVMVGTEFLDYLYTLFPGNLQLVAAAYNAGPGRVQQWITEYGSTDWSAISSHRAVQTFAQGQTYNYVNDVMNYYSLFSPGYSPGETCGPLPPIPPSSAGSSGGG